MGEDPSSYDLVLLVRRRQAYPGTNCPPSLLPWRDWSYRTHARVRWAATDYDLTPCCRQQPKLIILHWDDGGSRNPPDVLRSVREVWPDVPVVIASERPSELPLAPEAVGVETPRSVAFRDVLLRLNLSFPEVSSSRLHDESVRAEASYQALLSRITKADLNNIIEKYFPQVTGIRPGIVEGGWSGDPVIELHLSGRPSARYYLKLAFFRSKESASETLQRAVLAQSWLGDRTVGLHPPVGGLDRFDSEPTETLLEVFPGFADQFGQSYLPICWKSASSDMKREPLRSLYPRWTFTDARNALAATLAILAQAQPQEWRDLEPSQEPSRGAFYFNEFSRREASRQEVSVLARYARGCVSWRDQAEADARECLTALSSAMWPAWVRASCNVRVGHVHGDPNSGNLLVNVEQTDDVMLIDCGAYRKDGFLVADLARIEAEIKFVLMESEADGFGDIDPDRLEMWIPIERQCLQAGLALSEAFVDVQFAHLSAAIRKAYKLVAVVRQAARLYSEPHDSTGRHYFAVLAATTLRWLSSRHLRHPKKLLAVYSAAEILRLKL